MITLSLSKNDKEIRPRHKHTMTLFSVQLQFYIIQNKEKNETIELHYETELQI